jgi:hypothetical protein
VLFLLEEKGLARNGERGVILKHLRLSAFNPNALGFNGDSGSQADGETGTVGEVDLKVGAIVAIFKDRALLNDFPAEFFALNHGFDLPERNRDSAISTPVPSILEHITLIVCRLIVVKDKPL